MSSTKRKFTKFESEKKIQESRRKNQESSDEDEDEAFSFADLVRALTGGDSSKGENAIDTLKETFKILDCDGDGFITLPDLRKAMNGFHEVDDEDTTENDPDDAELVEMITAADDEGNGRITFKSFVKMIDPKLAEKSFSSQSYLKVARSSLKATNK